LTSSTGEGAIDLRANQPENLPVVGEAPRGSLGENQLAVDVDLEHAAVGGDQLAIDAQVTLELSRQTGGAGLVVSFAAVFDLYLHESILARHSAAFLVLEQSPPEPLSS